MLFVPYRKLNNIYLPQSRIRSHTRIVRPIHLSFTGGVCAGKVSQSEHGRGCHFRGRQNYKCVAFSWHTLAGARRSGSQSHHGLRLDGAHSQPAGGWVWVAHNICHREHVLVTWACSGGSGPWVRAASNDVVLGVSVLCFSHWPIVGCEHLVIRRSTTNNRDSLAGQLFPQGCNVASCFSIYKDYVQHEQKSQCRVVRNGMLRWSPSGWRKKWEPVMQRRAFQTRQCPNSKQRCGTAGMFRLSCFASVLYTPHVVHWFGLWQRFVASWASWWANVCCLLAAVQSVLLERNHDQDCFCFLSLHSLNSFWAVNEQTLPDL